MNPAYVVDGVTYEYTSWMKIPIGEYEVCSISYGSHGVKFHGLYLTSFKDAPKTFDGPTILQSVWTSNVWDAKMWHGGDVAHAINLAERLRDVSS